LNYRQFFRESQQGRLVSPWHDIPVNLSDINGRELILPFVCEIPRLRTEKMEVLLTEEYNPIAQDVKDGKPRYLSIQPKFNYGMFPQTFENPSKDCTVSGFPGDGDPIDVVDITTGGSQLDIGHIVPVRVLGSFCYIDGGESDWKVIVSRCESDQINKHVLDEIFGFFENYKMHSGNYIFENRKVFNPSETLDILKCTKASYDELLQSYRSTTCRGESDTIEPLNIWIPGAGTSI
jgi:inorganic pyrophosphatase